MKYLFSFFIILFIIVSCQKNSQTTNIHGTWKLVEIKDKTTLTTQTKPTAEPKDVLINFKNYGYFSGQTQRNNFWSGSYQLKDTNILFGEYAITDVAENNFGGSFLTVLSSCFLQSVHPCQPCTYTIEGKRMIIKSPLRYELVLEKQ